MVLISQVIVFKLAVVFFGKEGFGEYALVRRVIALIQLPLLLGLGISMTRYIANACITDQKKREADTYFVSGLCIGVLVVCVFLLTIHLFAEEFAYLFFGSDHYTYYITPLSISVLGISLHSLAYSHYRGNLKIFHANSLQFVNMAIVPISVFFIQGISVPKLFLVMGLSWTLVSALVILMISRTLGIRSLKISEIRYKAKELLRYGLRRVPGETGLGGLLSLPAIFVAHVSGVAQAGLVAFSVSLLNLVGAMFTPIGVILLPSASRMLANNGYVMLRKTLIKVLKGAIALTLTITIFLELFMHEIITAYLGAEFFEAVGIARITLLGATPYVIYVILRDLLDAASIKALNTKNILISFLVFILISNVGNSLYNILIGLCTGLLVLGILTAFDGVKVLKRKDEAVLPA